MTVKKIYSAPRTETVEYKVQNVLKVASTLPGGMMPPRKENNGNLF